MTKSVSSSGFSFPSYIKPFAEVKPIKRYKQIKEENDATKSTKQVPPKKSGYQASVISSPITVGRLVGNCIEIHALKATR